MSKRTSMSDIALDPTKRKAFLQRQRKAQKEADRKAKDEAQRKSDFTRGPTTEEPKP